MKALLATTCIVGGVLFAGGCATKQYVRNTAAPIQAKVDQVDRQTADNAKQIGDTRDQVKDVDERSQNGISAARERAMTADQNAANADKHAGDAMNRADQATQTANQNTQAIDGLKGVIANIDDYKLQTSVTVPFGFNRHVLTPDAQKDLDTLADGAKRDQRFVIAVEGYTDSVGDKEYNEALSRRRAEAVVEYLVAKHDIPIYRIHLVGLGDQKPVDEAKSRAARAKNRRVEVKVFTADQAMAEMSKKSD
jgi:OmpA-OmpF porin, OOP family